MFLDPILYQNLIQLNLISDLFFNYVKSIGKDLFVAYHPFPNFFKKIGDAYYMDTVDFAVALRDAGQTFVCGVLFEVSVIDLELEKTFKLLIRAIAWNEQSLSIIFIEQC